MVWLVKMSAETYRRFGINDFITIKEGESEGYSSCYYLGVDQMNNNNYCNPLVSKTFPFLLFIGGFSLNVTLQQVFVTYVNDDVTSE